MTSFSRVTRTLFEIGKNSLPPDASHTGRAGFGSTDRLRASVHSFECGAADEHFEGTRLTGAQCGHAASAGPLLDVVDRLFSPERGFRAALARAYGTALEPFCEQLVVVQGMRVSGNFFRDAVYRHQALEQLCAETLDGPGMLVVHPPTTFWRAGDQQAHFRLHGERDKDLLLCVLIGALGFAQLCDDLLRHPVPLLVRPWSPKRGLLRPRRLPRKTYSGALCVERLNSRRLVLFDKECSRRL